METVLYRDQSSHTVGVPFPASVVQKPPTKLAYKYQLLSSVRSLLRPSTAVSLVLFQPSSYTS
jgi:hypothetical protein